MNRIRQGWLLTRTSWTVLRSDRSLAAFPVLSAIAALLAAAAFGIPSLLFFDDDMTVPGVIFAAVAIYLVTFAAVFFSVALAAAAAQVLDGHDATVVAGILSTALTQIFAVALHRHATGHGATGAFTESTLANSIVPRTVRPGQI